MYWIFVFLFYALVAGIFGFTGLASTERLMAQILFFVFSVLLLISFFHRGAPQLGCSTVSYQ